MTGRKTQSDRFKETAREHEVDESEGALDRIMGRLSLRRKPERDGSDKGESSPRGEKDKS